MANRNMALPAFLQRTSPPRSPHVVKPSPFNSYFEDVAHSTSSIRGSYFTLRPTKRDLLLCLLTFSFSYLFLHSPPGASHPISSYTNTQGGSKSNIGYRIPVWPFGSGNTPSTPAVKSSVGGQSTIVEEESYTDSVKPVGMSAEVLQPHHGGGVHAWDEGQEAAEDDELGGVITVLRGHQPGWTLMERVYVYNGSFYVVTDQRSDWPELKMMTSTGLPANDEPGNYEKRLPTGQEIKFVTPYQAVHMWGPRVYKMSGMTWLFNDGQFIDHYYHFAAELLLGTWRTYATLDQNIAPDGTTTLPPPKRIWFLHQPITEWRDEPKFNPLITTALFPSISYLYPEDFAGMANSTHSSTSAFMLERALLVDRTAAFHGEWTAPTSRTVANALHVGKVSRWWWEPLRRQILRYSGVSELIISRNLEGFGAIDPVNVNPGGVNDLEPLVPSGDYKPVVTYISRQSSRRRLTNETHAELVNALEERSVKIGFELVIVEAEKMSKEEQFALAGRTTILLGVHGNGLSHLLWMPATPRSAVIEMFINGGFARDYQWTAHALGIRHFGINHDTSFTSPSLPKVDYPEGFQGTGITVVGKVVADLIEDRLAGKV